MTLPYRQNYRLQETIKAPVDLYKFTGAFLSPEFRLEKRRNAQCFEKFLLQLNVKILSLESEEDLLQNLGCVPNNIQIQGDPTIKEWPTRSKDHCCINVLGVCNNLFLEDFVYLKG